MRENDNWGARIERGTIDEVSGKKYKVKSLSRDGVKTPWIEVLSIKPTLYGDVYVPTEYKSGDMVYYFMFPDGHGAILGKAE